MYIPPSNPPKRSRRPMVLLLALVMVVPFVVSSGASATGAPGIPIAGDWNGDGSSTPGWFHNGDVLLSNADASGSRQVIFRFGRAGDVPIVGDWNGDGADSIGVIRDRTWHLKYQNVSGAADRSFIYGRLGKGDYALAGDWNGDGRDGVGIVRTRDGEWHLRNSLTGGPGEVVFTYGRVRSGDIPVVGDWNADGIDTPGIIRNRTWHLRDVNRGGVADRTFFFGRSSDTPLVGNWNGRGGDTPGVVRGITWHLRNSPSGGAAHESFDFGAGNPGDRNTSGRSGGDDHHTGTNHDHHTGTDNERTRPDDIEADVVLSGDYPEGITVDKDQTARIDGLVTTPANVVVHGTLVMRPGSHLRFRDVDMTKFVGAQSDHHHQQIVESDVGLWVTEEGLLDLAGSPKQSWNRTGTHATWESGDELWIAPTDIGDHAPQRWQPGDPIPKVDPRVPPAEVLNVSRDVVVEGPAHIHIHSHVAQRVEYVELRSMGVSNSRASGPVLGRYALHLHHGGDGTRGTVIRGVASIGGLGRQIVPHASHGVTIEDVAVVNSFAEGLWWDKSSVADLSNDITIDRLAVVGVNMPRAVSGSTSRHNAISLPQGENLTIRNSVAAGAHGNRLSNGFHWDSNARQPSVWEFNEGNVSHNNQGAGLRFWTNSNQDHVVQDAISYRDGKGIDNGAYRNTVRWSDVLVLEAGVGALQHANSGEHVEDGGPARFVNVHVETMSESCDPETGMSSCAGMEVGNRNLPSSTYHEFIDSSFVGAPGHPKVYVTEGDNPWRARFVRSNVEPDDFEFETLCGGNDGTRILIDHEDGRKWEIALQGCRRVVTDR